MKKYLLLVIIFMLFLITSCKENNYKRLRIISCDQSTSSSLEKNLIKDVLKQGFAKKILTYDSDVSSYDKYLEAQIPSSIYQKISVEEKLETYPSKSYHDNFIPSGVYPSIVITIGEGCGPNFWTILYPEYFGYEFDEDNEINYTFYFMNIINK